MKYKYNKKILKKRINVTIYPSTIDLVKSKHKNISNYIEKLLIKECKDEKVVGDERMAFSRCDDQYKKEINSLLARYGRRDKQSIILDGGKAETSKTLIRNGFKANTIYIPNPTKDFEFIKDTYKKSRNIPDVVNCWLNELIVKWKVKHSIGLAYLDYMCTLHGNDNCKPIDDINLMFNKKLFSDGSCLAVTISTHDGRKSKSIFKNQDLLELLNVVSIASLQNEYTIEVLKGAGSYRKSMWTVLFKVYKK